MGLLARIRRFFRKEPSESAWVATGGASPFGFPSPWSADRAQQVNHYRHWVYVAVRARSEMIAQHTPQVALVAPSTDIPKGRRLSRAIRRKALTQVNAHEELMPVDQDHPLMRLLENPNEPDTSYDFWYEANLFLDLTGITYIWVVTNGFGLPTELWVIPSHWVCAKSSDGKTIDSYEVRPYGTATTTGYMTLPASAVIAIRDKSPLSKVDGWSPLEAGSMWIDSAEAIDASRYHSFQQGAWPGMAIKLPEGADPTQEDIERIQSKFMSKYQGVRKIDKPAVLSPGMEVVPLTISPREMHYFQSAEQMRDWVLALYKVSKVIAGITTETSRANVDGAQAAFCTFAINPRTRFLGKVLTEKLAKRFDPHLRIYWDDCTPDDALQQLAENQADAIMGAITPNEIRELRGRAAYKFGGDDPIVPLGMSPLPLNTGEESVEVELPQPQPSINGNGKRQLVEERGWLRPERKDW